MKDIVARIEKLTTEAAECDLIANLAIEEKKRSAFAGLAAALRREIGELKNVLTAMQADLASDDPS